MAREAATKATGYQRTVVPGTWITARKGSLSMSAQPKKAAKAFGLSSPRPLFTSVTLRFFLHPLPLSQPQATNNMSMPHRAVDSLTIAMLRSLHREDLLVLAEVR